MRSISRRLLVPLLAALTVAAFLAGISTYLKVLKEVNEFFDYQLQQMAYSLRYQNGFEQRPKAILDFEKDEDVTVQVWESSGKLLYASSQIVPPPRASHTGLQTVTIQSKKWRVFLLTDSGRTIQVSQTFKDRQETSFEFALRTVFPLFFIFSALAIIIWIVVRYTLKPLTGVANAVELLSPTSLEPLSEHNLPLEILPLVQRLNFLFQQLGHAFDLQKRFVSDAAHELRTPLTAIKLQVRILERSANEAERADALVSLKSGVDRTARMVNQLLALARVEPEAVHLPLVEVSLNRLIQEIIAELSWIALDKGITLVVHQEGEVSVMGEPDALRSMISNLVDNAIRYTPPGGSVDVLLHKHERAAIVEIADTGPGIPPKEREHIFERFYRGHTTDSNGCGLGMAIVKSALQRHGGTILLSETSVGIGLKVTLTLLLDPLD